MPITAAAARPDATPSHPLPLVGRRRELDRVLQTVQAAGTGTTSTALLIGEPGIGKTRLLEEVADRSTAHDWAVLTAVCSLSSRLATPLQPVLTVIDAAASRWPGLIGDLTAPVRRGLGPLLADADDALPDRDTDDLAGTRLMAAVARLLEVASGRQPLLLLVDDVHWADPASRDLMSFLVSRLRDRPVAMVLASRPADAQPAAVRSWLSHLERHSSVTTIDLAPLDDAAVSELLADIPESRRARIVALADGIPFYARHLAEHPDPSTLPKVLRDVLLDAVQELPDDSRQLLLTLAVAGPWPEPDLVNIAALPGPEAETDTDTALRVLLRTGLVRRADGVVALRQTLLRDVVVSDALPGDLRAAHRRIVRALLAAPADGTPHRAALLAEHLRAGGQIADAAPYVLQTARRAMRLCAFGTAEEHYDWLLRHWPAAHPLAETASTVDGADRATIIVEAAQVTRWSGHPAVGLRLLAGLPTSASRPALLLLRGQLQWAMGAVSDALASYEQAHRLLGSPELADSGASTTVPAEVLAAFAQGLMVSGQATAALGFGAAAVEAANRVGAPRVQVHAAITTAAANAQLGNTAAAVSALRAAVIRATDLDDVDSLVRAHGNLTFALGQGGNPAAVAEAAVAGIEACQRYGPVLSRASTLHNNLVTALTEIGRWDEATAAAQAALADDPAPGVSVYLNARLAEIAAAQGRLDLATAALDRVGTAPVVDPYARTALAVARAATALAAADPGAAAEAASGGLAALADLDDPVPTLQVAWWGLRGCADRSESQPGEPGGSESARGFWEAAMTAHSQAAAGAELAQLWFDGCTLEHHRVGGTDEPEQWATWASAHHARGRTALHAYARYRHGGALLRHRRRQGAVVSLTQARELAGSLGAAPLLREIDELAAAAGLLLAPTLAAANAGAAGPFDVLGLTDREREVWRLLADGLTNRQIGSRLFIAERTAGVHVGNILRKLGVANRTQAAQLSRRAGHPTLALPSQAPPPRR